MGSGLTEGVGGFLVLDLPLHDAVVLVILQSPDLGIEGVDLHLQVADLELTILIL